MPVYNEGAVIGTVLEEWLRVLDGLGVAYRLRVRNDGSCDGTSAQLAEIVHECVEVIHSENLGHGPTLVAEYARAFEEADWVFQTDSDGEQFPQDFPAFWEKREEADFCIGVRQHRGGPVSRRVVSRVLRGLMRYWFGGDLLDANCPFRLMRSAAFRSAMEHVPSSAFAPNVLLAGFALRRGLCVRQFPVMYRFREAGEASIRHVRLARAACLSALQARAFSRCPALSRR